MLVIDMAAEMGLGLPARFAALTHDLGKGSTPAAVLPRHIGHEKESVALLGPLCERLRVPADCRELALLAARYHGDVHRGGELRPETMLRIFSRCDLFRRPERFSELLAVCEADHRGRGGYAQRPYPQRQRWERVAAAARAVDAGAVAGTAGDAARIPALIEAARTAAIAAVLEEAEQQGGEQ
jgi:tRNA nucleotidyltransferase (CCA-adding enzyme)